MPLILILSFLGVFIVIALPLFAVASGSTKKTKRVMNAVDAALSGSENAKSQSLLDLRKDEQFSSIPWLNSKLLHLELMPHLQALLDQADVKWSVGRLLSLSGVCGLVPGYIVHLRYHNLPIALLTGLITSAAPMIWILQKRTRRLDLFVQQLPEGLDLMVSGLRAGHSLVSALSLIANECPNPLGQEFKSCFEEQNYGLELKTAFDNMTRRVPVQDLRIVTSAIMIQKESGGNLAELIDKTAETIRQRFRLKRQIKVHTAQGRMTGLILGCLPLFLGILLYFINPGLMSVLWKDPAGVKLLCVSVGMTTLGGLIIRNIVNMDV